MSFWLVYLAGAASAPLSLVFSELALYALDRLQGGKGIAPRENVRIFSSLALSWVAWTAIIAGLYFWMGWA